MRALRSAASVLCAWASVGACGGDGPTQPPGSSVTGTLVLTISTTGRDLDLDGYTVTVDAGSPVTVPANVTASIPNVSAGVRTVALGGVAPNCTLVTPAALEVTLSGPEGASVRFEVTCSLVYTLAYQGHSGVELTDAAGTVHRTLVPDARPLAWSPDGRSLAIVRHQDRKTLWLVNPDDGIPRLLAHIADPHIQGISSAKWAPDGRDLLYEVFGFPNSVPFSLYRIALDGSFNGYGGSVAPGNLACISWMQAGNSPDWSPDGTQIVVHEPIRQPPSEGFTIDPEVYILSRDGSNRRFLVTGQQPDWSPDRSAIAFVAGRSACAGVLRSRTATLHLIGSDGTNDRQLTSPAQNETDENPAWSPDGSRVAFVRLGMASDSTVTSVLAYVIDADGANQHQLAVLPRNERSVIFRPSWSPDGLQLAYSGEAGTYVVNADGSGFRVVSDTSACCISAQWRP